MAAFLDLYGGYADLPAMLDELKLYGVAVDPTLCHPFELYAYAFWCAIAGFISIVGVYLWRKDKRKRVLFRNTVLVPAILYTPITFGFTMACNDQGKTQEPGFGLCLLIIEPVLTLHMLRLVRDACRRGLNPKVFPLPLTRWEWRYLLLSLAFHLGLIACGACIVHYANTQGRLLLALECSLLLRSVRPHPTVCPEGEINTSLTLLGTCLTVVLVGHFSTGRTKAAEPYRKAWKLGVTVPTALQALVLTLTLFTCNDVQQSQEHLLYPCLIAIQLFAFLLVLRSVHKANGTPDQWVYIGLVPYHAIALIGTIVCLIWLALVGPLMSETFTVQWEKDPQPGSVQFVFFSLCLLHLIGLLSIILFDPDESERDPTPEELQARAEKKEERRRRKELLRRYGRKRKEHCKRLSGMIRWIVKRVVEQRRKRARTAVGSPKRKEPEFVIPPPPVRPPKRKEGVEAEATTSSTVVEKEMMSLVQRPSRGASGEDQQV